MPSSKPPYKTYRARKRPWDRFRKSRFDKLQKSTPAQPGDPDFPAPPPSRSREDVAMQPTPPKRKSASREAPAQRQPKPPKKQRVPRAASGVPWSKKSGFSGKRSSLPRASSTTPGITTWT